MAAAPSTPTYDSQGIRFLDIDEEGYKVALMSVVSQPKGGYSLRRFACGYQSCYASAIVYILIGMLSDKGLVQRNDIIHTLLKFNRLESSLLRQLIANNAALPSSIKVFDIRSLNGVFESGILFLGLVSPSRSPEHEYGRVNHYFILKKIDDENYLIFSSYGSYNVAIRQYQSSVTAKEFNSFLASFSKDGSAMPPGTSDNGYKTEEDRRIVSQFIKDKFLNTSRFKIDQKNTIEEYDEEFGDISGVKITDPNDPRLAKNGDAQVEREVESYLRRPCNVMLFPNIIDILQNEINGAELKKARAEGQEYHEILEKARESASTLSAKMAETGQQVLHAHYALEGTPKKDMPEYEPDKSISIVSETAMEEIEKILTSPPTPERADGREEDLSDAGFPDVSENILERFGLSNETSPLKKRTRQGTRYGGKRKTKKRKTRKRTRKYKIR